MSHFAPRLLRTFTATHLGNESALRQQHSHYWLRSIATASTRVARRTGT